MLTHPRKSQNNYDSKPKCSPERVTSAKERIQSAARLLLRQGGESTVTVRGTAATLGINGSALYRHYISRDDLLTHMCIEYLEEIQQIVCTTIATQDDPRTVIVTASHQIQNWTMKNPSEFRLLYTFVGQNWATNRRLTLTALSCVESFSAPFFGLESGKTSSTVEVPDDCPHPRTIAGRSTRERNRQNTSDLATRSLMALIGTLSLQHFGYQFAVDTTVQFDACLVAILSRP